jgi:hypothetical protein
MQITPARSDRPAELPASVAEAAAALAAWASEQSG